MMAAQDLANDANTLFPCTGPLLSSILFRYSAVAPVKDLSFHSSITFGVAHDFLLQKILSSHHLKQYPPSESYQQSFWKWALVQLESLSQSDEDEIDERIYTHYTSLKTLVGSETPPNSFVTYYWKHPEVDGYLTEQGCYETITLLESRATIEAGTTGLRTWRASLALAQYLIHHPYLVETSNVIELGSGSGFVGILVASLQLHAAVPPFHRKLPSVYLTDVNSTVLERCQNNVRLPCNKSSFHPSIHYKSLDWLDSLTDQEGIKGFFVEAPVDILLGADIVFDPVLVPSLVQTISLALSPEFTRIMFIALTVRSEGTLAYFLDEIKKVLEIKEIADDVTGTALSQIPDQVDAELDVKIYKVCRASEL